MSGILKVVFVIILIVFLDFMALIFSESGVYSDYSYIGVMSSVLKVLILFYIFLTKGRDIKRWIKNLPVFIKTVFYFYLVISASFGIIMYSLLEYLCGWNSINAEKCLAYEIRMDIVLWGISGALFVIVIGLVLYKKHFYPKWKSYEREKNKVVDVSDSEGSHYEGAEI